MKVYKGYQFKSAVAELITKVAKDLDRTVRIRWDAGISTAGIDHHGRMILSDVADDANLSHADLVKYCGFGVHEILHAKYTDFSYRPDEQYLDQLHNAVEDAWIEQKGIDNKLTGNIANLLTTLVNNMATHANQVVDDWADPRQYPFALAVYLRDHASVKVPLADGLQPIFDEAKRRLPGCASSKDTLEIANWVMDQLNNLPKNPPQKSQKGSTKPDQGQGEGEGKGDASDASGKGGKGGKPVGPARRPSGADAMSVEPTNDAPEGKGGAGSYSESSVQPDNYHLTDDVWLTKDVPVPAKLRYAVKRLFDDSGINEFQRNRKSGSVNVHALPSVSYNDKVFKRRHEVDGIDTCVAILLDVSGSMFADGDYDRDTGKAERILTATQSCIALLETLQKAGVSTTVLTFGSSVSVLKPFEMPTVKAVAALRRIDDGGSTNDYFAVRYAHKLLLNRPEQRKICFVLTDGDGYVGACRDQVLTGERLGVTTIGLGIQHEVDHVYPQNATVQDLSQLGNVSFKQIKLAA